MTEEIGRLGLLVNEFDHPFHSHPGFLKTYKKVKVTCVDSYAAKNNLKFNTLSLIISIGAVQSPREGLGKEYDGSLFKFSNSSDLWGAKGNGRSVFRNYSMLHEWCGNVHVYVSLKILEWEYSELPELSGEVRLKNSLRQFTELVWLKIFLTFRLFDLSDCKLCSHCFARGFW